MELVKFYESVNQLETAYLARWAVLEKFVKAVTAEYRRCMLKHALRQWSAYVNGNLPVHPKERLDTRLKAKHLPEKSEFIAALNYFGFDGAELWGIMGYEGKAKPRGFRNQIAHTGRRFTRVQQYKKLSNLLALATRKTVGI